MADLPADDGLEGRYANFFQVGFNAYEFVIEFGQEYAPAPEHVHTRIVTSAPLAQRLSETLKRSIRDFESKYPATDDMEGDRRDG